MNPYTDPSGAAGEPSPSAPPLPGNDQRANGQSSPGQPQPGYAPQAAAQQPQAGAAFAAVRNPYEPAPVVNDRPWLKYDVTQDEYDYMASLFINFDDDDGGTLDRREVTRLAKWLNYPSSPSDIEELFRQTDRDGNGSLDLNEFLAFYMDKKPDPQFLYGMTQREYNDTLIQFRTYDSNFDGCLSIEEFTQLALQQSVVGQRQEAEDIFRSIDTDGNGIIDLHEFLTYMKPFRGLR